MYHLLIVVISIMLSAAAATAYTVYSPSASIERQRVYMDAQKGIQSMEAAVVRYLDRNRDESGLVVHPGNGVDMEPLIVPAYGFMPAPVRNRFAWHVVGGEYQGLPAVAICLAPVGAIEAGIHDALDTLRSRMPVGSAVLASGCGAQVHDPLGNHLTYWVVLGHMD